MTKQGKLYAFVVATLGLSMLLSNMAFASDPEQLVRQTVEDTLSVMQAERESFKTNSSKVEALLQEQVAPHFDFQTMGRFVLGKNWRNASPELQESFVEKFRTRLIKTYAVAFQSYTDEKVPCASARATDTQGDRTMIRCEVQKAGKQPVAVHFRLHRQGGGWKVYDVIVENISLLTNYRSQMANQVSEMGLERAIESFSTQAQKVQHGGG